MPRPTIEGKTANELLEQMKGHVAASVDFEYLRMGVNMRLVDKLCDSMSSLERSWNRSSKVMYFLTAALAFFTAIQTVALFVK